MTHSARALASRVFFGMALELKDTLQLPKTDFPMRAGLAQREPGRVAHWDKIGLFDAIQRHRAGAPAFVLHDGPPFTNGDVHIGTALNIVIKDAVNRYKSMRGATGHIFNLGHGILPQAKLECMEALVGTVTGWK